MHMDILPECRYVYPMHAWYLQRPKEGVDTRNWSYRPLLATCGGWESKPGPPQG